MREIDPGDILLPSSPASPEPTSTPAAGPREIEPSEITLPATREGVLVAPYNAKIRETVWRALNPGATGPMPENYDLERDVSPEMKQKAERFIMARQKDLRMRNIAVILGDDKGGTKKGFSQEKRREMLRDMEGVIEDNEYDALAKYLGARTMPPDPTGAQNDLLTLRLTHLRAECQPFLDPMADNAHKTASREFYAELGRKIFEDNAIGAGASAEEQAILKKHTGVSLLNVMTGVDADFEKMKREQLLEYADQKEKTRFRKTLETFWHNYQTLPTWKKVVIGSSISAGVATAGVFFLAPSIPLLAGQSLLLTEMGAGAYAGSRIARSAAAFPLAGFLRSIMIPRAEKKYARQQAELRSVHAQKAGEAVDTARTWLAIAQDMQKTAQENERAMEKLKGKQWWKRMGVNVGVGVVAGVAVGFAMPKATDAAAGLGGSPKGLSPDSYLGQKGIKLTPPHTPPTPSTLPETPPPGSPPVKTVRPTTPAPAPTPAPDAYVPKGLGYRLAHPWEVLQSIREDLFGIKTAEPSAVVSEPQPPGSPPVKTVRPTTPAPEAAPAPSGARAAADGELLDIKTRGPQGAMIDAMVGKGIPKPKAGTFASQIWENNKARLAQDPRMIVEMKKYGYTNIDDMMRRLQTGGRLRMVGFDPAHTDPASIKNVRIEFDENVRAMHPLRPRVSQQPTYADYKKGMVLPDQPKPSTALPPQEPAPGIVAQQSIDYTQRNVEHFRFRSSYDPQEWDKINKSATIKELGDEIDRLEKAVRLSNTDNGSPVTSTVITGVIDERQVSRLRGMYNELHKTTTLGAEGIERMSEHLARTKGGVTGLPTREEVREMARIKKELVRVFEDGLTIGDTFREIDLAQLARNKMNQPAPVGRPQAPAPLPINPEGLEAHVATPPGQARIRPGSQPN